MSEADQLAVFIPPSRVTGSDKKIPLPLEDVSPVKVIPMGTEVPPPNPDGDPPETTDDDTIINAPDSDTVVADPGESSGESSGGDSDEDSGAGGGDSPEEGEEGELPDEPQSGGQSQPSQGGDPSTDTPDGEDVPPSEDGGKPGAEQTGQEDPDPQGSESQPTGDEPEPPQDGGDPGEGGDPQDGGDPGEGGDPQDGGDPGEGGDPQDGGDPPEREVTHRPPRRPENTTIEDLIRGRSKAEERRREDEVGDIEQPEADFPDPEEESEIDSSIKEGAQSIQRGKNTLSDDVIASALPVQAEGGADSMIPALADLKSGNASDWRKLLKKIISRAAGIGEKYNPALPSRTLEGQLGRRQDVPQVDNILIMLDCSVSMGPPQFKAVLQELDTMGQMPKFRRAFRRAKIHLVKWASGFRSEPYEYAYKKTKGLKNIYQSFISMPATSGGSAMGPAAVKILSSRIGRIDLHINMTDGQLNSSDLDDKAYELFRKKRLRNRTVWIFPQKKQGRHIKRYDSGWERRSIVFKKGS